MTQPERELQVERFMACEMKLDEEHEFVMLAATDPDLFRTLRAYRHMDQALTRNRDALPNESYQVYSHALGLLKNTLPSHVAEKENVMPSRSWITMAVTALLGAVTGFLWHGLLY